MPAPIDRESGSTSIAPASANSSREHRSWLRLRERAPERPILLTFFSPSGIESVPPDVADHVDYLPLDSPRAMRRFALIPVADTVLIKYELWPGLLSARLEAGCRVHLVAARFDRGRFPANRWGAGIRSLLSAFTTVQVQDDESAAIMARFGIDCDVTGDPRAWTACWTPCRDRLATRSKSS